MARILVIEDEPSNQLLYQSRLKDLGHDVTVCETGAQGIAEARTSRYDLHLVDMHLGSGVDGIEVCRRLKRDPDTRHVPVVIISQKIKSRADLHRGYEAGCEAFLVKDDNFLIEDVVRAMLRIKSLQDELSLQMGLLQQHNERLQQALRDKADLESRLATHSSDAGSSAGFTPVPDAVLLVGADGTVQFSDRGAQEIFGKKVEGKSLGSLAPGTRLEAFVRDAHSAPHRAFRFTVSARGSRPAQNLVACAIPFVPKNVASESDQRILLLFEEFRQSLLWEALQNAACGYGLSEIGSLVEIARREHAVDRVLGDSPHTVALRARLAELVNTADPVLVSGEVGTGKSHVARVLHFGGNRTGGFVAVECVEPRAAEEQIFGGEGRAGALRNAHGGTLHVQDIDRLPHAAQRRLVLALDEERPLPGGKRTGRLDVRLVLSASRPLRGSELDPLLAERVGSSTLLLEPLRERIGDVQAMARHFLGRLGTSGDRVSEDAWAALEGYDWPGNVQELEAVVRHARATAGPDGDVLAEHLPAPLPELALRLAPHGSMTPARRSEPVRGTHHAGGSSAQDRDRRSVLEKVLAALPDPGEEQIPTSFEFFELWALTYTLMLSDNDKLEAARRLKVGKSTLYRKIHKYHIKG